MKRLIIILLAMLPMLFVAKAETIKVDSVGKLATVLPDSVRFTIADLSVSGPLNGADLKLLQQIVTRNKTNKSNPKECLVTSIDLFYGALPQVPYRRRHHPPEDRLQLSLHLHQLYGGAQPPAR